MVDVIIEARLGIMETCDRIKIFKYLEQCIYIFHFNIRKMSEFSFILIFIFGFMALAMMIERFIMLQWTYSINFKTFLGNFKKAVIAEDVDRALAICRSASHEGGG